MKNKKNKENSNGEEYLKVPKGSALLKTLKGTEIVGELGENEKAIIAGKKKDEEFIC